MNGESQNGVTIASGRVEGPANVRDDVDIEDSREELTNAVQISNSVSVSVSATDTSIEPSPHSRSKGSPGLALELIYFSSSRPTLQ